MYCRVYALSGLILLIATSACAINPNQLPETPVPRPSIVPSASPDSPHIIVIPTELLASQPSGIPDVQTPVQPAASASGTPRPAASPTPKPSVVPKPLVPARPTPTPSPSSQVSTLPSSPAFSGGLTDPVFRPSSQPVISPSPQSSALVGGASATPIPTPLPTLPPLVITGQSNFTHSFPFQVGMKWLYKLRQKITFVDGTVNEDPNPPQVNLEVISLDNNQVTFSSQVVPAGSSPPRSLTVPNDNMALANVFVSPASNQVGGTIAWSAPVSESVTVQAGTYPAEQFSAAMSLVSSYSNGTAIDQNLKLWLSSTDGMVKEETITNYPGAPYAFSSIIELQSFYLPPAPGS